MFPFTTPRASRRPATLTATLAAALSLAVAAPAAAQNFSMSSMGATSSATTFSIAFSEVITHNTPYRIQIATGQQAARMAMDAGLGELDIFLFSAPITQWMRDREQMFAEMEQAPELAENLRTVMAYPLGAYQFVVWEDSGIKSFEDLAGREVYMGPPSGAAAIIASRMVESISGLKAGEDYKVSRLDWASGLQAFQDRQLDLYVSPESIPSGGITQLAAQGKFRILGVDEATIQSDVMAEMRDAPGRSVGVIPAGLYGDNQMNETDVSTIGTWVGLGVREGMDEEAVYQMTKALWENLDDLHATAKWMSVITPETAFNELNAPLHPGAYRYYQEAGFDVPEEIIPEGAE